MRRRGAAKLSSSYSMSARKEPEQGAGAASSSRADILTRIRLLLIDDHAIVREGITALLERDNELLIVGSVATGEEAIVAARDLRPDVVIMDLVLPDLSGIEATRQILADSPDSRVIALSAREGTEHVYQALRAGVRGYVVKASALAELVLAVKTVSAGRSYLSPSIAGLFPAGIAAAEIPKSPYERLSTRERDVLRRIVAGASSADIAQHLSLSRKTVDTYRGRLMVKLGVPNRSALIRLAIENELTTL